ncbi:hypothetical protein FSARC_12962 [Fusarium sarcochroum]|uniref:Uncharacterized protein n=1 Tax=Fusarium sarcochroum TaxID=1208366 RepID=A0A8H4T4V8_9HYPO|nr:hypothetical protein FSARC_12962 [Fusarium sarcochroum]
MCQECASNGKRTIAGYSVREYCTSWRNHEQWRLRLCIELQATLIFNMCNAGVTPNTRFRDDQDIGHDLWALSTLDIHYDYNFKKELRKKYLERAKSLLQEMVKFSAFAIRRNGRDTVYLWNTVVVEQHFGSVRSVAIWLESNRAQARSRHEQAEQNMSPRSQTDTRPPMTPRRRERFSSLASPRTTTAPRTPTTPRFFVPSTPTSGAVSGTEGAMHELEIGTRAVNKAMTMMNMTSMPAMASSAPASALSLAGLSLRDASQPGSPMSPRTPSAGWNFGSIQPTSPMTPRPPTSAGWNFGAFQPASPMSPHTPRSPTSGGWNTAPVPLDFNRPPPTFAQDLKFRRLESSRPSPGKQNPFTEEVPLAMRLLDQQLARQTEPQPRQSPTLGGLLPVNYQSELPPPIPSSTRPPAPNANHTPESNSPNVPSEPVTPRKAVHFGRAARLPHSSPHFSGYRQPAVEDGKDDDGDDKMSG